MNTPRRKRVSLARGKSRTSRAGTGSAMLDLYTVKRQIDAMVADEQVAQESFQTKLEIALREFRRWGEAWTELAGKIAGSRTSWLLPGLAEPLDRGYGLPPRPERISIAATDGSQIFPDRHEVSSCYLINIGYVLLHYGTGDKPLMSSRPTLYYREEDLYEEWGGRRMFVNRELVGFKRSSMEFTELAELALAAAEEGYRVVAMVDGTLIQWNLEGKPRDFKQAYLEAALTAFERLRQARIPVAGYISQPGSQELVNALKLGLCPLATADCDRCPWKPENRLPGAEGEERVEGLPCVPIEGISDGVLLRRTLAPGERTPVCRSSSKILDEYGGHRVHYFYLHVGAEISRVEVPQWVAEDRELLDLVHACVCDQAEKGQGYPVSLAEAHERAVVRGADREAFYRFLRDTFVRNDLRTRISTKSMKKRHAGI
jgi:hypothetical protein